LSRISRPARALGAAAGRHPHRLNGTWWPLTAAPFGRIFKSIVDMTGSVQTEDLTHPTLRVRVTRGTNRPVVKSSKKGFLSFLKEILKKAPGKP
jgi:hypothetical protein